MCVNLGQLELSYEDTFRLQELESASFHASLLRQTDEPRNYRIGLWTEASFRLARSYFCKGMVLFNFSPEQLNKEARYLTFRGNS